MSIWKKPISVEQLTASGANTAVSHLGIELTEVGDDFLRGRVPVDERTRQPFGLLHGGVSVVLAETLGSMGAFYASPEGHRAVGLDINANHLRAATSGWVTGTARPVHIGRTTQVWQIDMVNDAGELTCVSRITMAVLWHKVPRLWQNDGRRAAPNVALQRLHGGHAQHRVLRAHSHQAAPLPVVLPEIARRP